VTAVGRGKVAFSAEFQSRQATNEIDVVEGVHAGSGYSTMEEYDVIGDASAGGWVTLRRVTEIAGTGIGLAQRLAGGQTCEVSGVRFSDGTFWEAPSPL
jgi:hypothetical protein